MTEEKQQYDDISQSYSEKVGPTKLYALFPTLVQMTGDVSHKRVLDLACGNGYFTRLLSHLHPKKLVGVDISSQMVNLASQEEKGNPSDIEYRVGDARKLDLPEKFDIITAVYLLNYASTRDELVQMAKNIYDHLDENGVLAAITASPRIRPRSDYRRGWRVASPDGKDVFSDGDKVQLISDPETGEPVTINFYYWSGNTYAECLKEAGFKEVEWKHKLKISEEGKRNYDLQFWNQVQEDTTAVGIKCIK